MHNKKSSGKFIKILYEAIKQNNPYGVDYTNTSDIFLPLPVLKQKDFTMKGEYADIAFQSTHGLGDYDAVFSKREHGKNISRRNRMRREEKNLAEAEKIPTFFKEIKEMESKKSAQLKTDLLQISKEIEDLKKNSKSTYQQNLREILFKFFTIPGAKIARRYLLLPLSSSLNMNVINKINLNKNVNDLKEHLNQNKNYLEDRTLDNEIKKYLMDCGYHFKDLNNDFYNITCYTKNNAKINIIDEFEKIKKIDIQEKEKVLQKLKQPNEKEKILLEIKKKENFKDHYMARMELIDTETIKSSMEDDVNVIILTWVPRMIMSQSTTTIWRSCMSLRSENNSQAGSNAHYVPSGIENGVFIAWLVNLKDINEIDEPKARILIKPYTLISSYTENSGNYGFFWWPSVVYHDGAGSNLTLFKRTLLNFCYQKQKSFFVNVKKDLKEKGIDQESVMTRVKSGVYHDSGDNFNVLKNLTMKSIFKKIKTDTLISLNYNYYNFFDAADYSDKKAINYLKMLSPEKREEIAKNFIGLALKNYNLTIFEFLVKDQGLQKIENSLTYALGRFFSEEVNNFKNSKIYFYKYLIKYYSKYVDFQSKKYIFHNMTHMSPEILDFLIKDRALLISFLENDWFPFNFLFNQKIDRTIKDHRDISLIIGKEEYDALNKKKSLNSVEELQIKMYKEVKLFNKSFEKILTFVDKNNLADIFIKKGFTDDAKDFFTFIFNLMKEKQLDKKNSDLLFKLIDRMKTNQDFKEKFVDFFMVNFIYLKNLKEFNDLFLSLCKEMLKNEDDRKKLKEMFIRGVDGASRINLSKDEMQKADKEKINNFLSLIKITDKELFEFFQKSTFNFFNILKKEEMKKIMDYIEESEKENVDSMMSSIFYALSRITSLSFEDYCEMIVYVFEKIKKNNLQYIAFNKQGMSYSFLLVDIVFNIFVEYGKLPSFEWLKNIFIISNFDIKNLFQLMRKVFTNNDYREKILKNEDFNRTIKYFLDRFDYQNYNFDFFNNKTAIECLELTVLRNVYPEFNFYYKILILDKKNILELIFKDPENLSDLSYNVLLEDEIFKKFLDDKKINTEKNRIALVKKYNFNRDGKRNPLLDKVLEKIKKLISPSVEEFFEKMVKSHADWPYIPQILKIFDLSLAEYHKTNFFNKTLESLKNEAVFSVNFKTLLFADKMVQNSDFNYFFEKFEKMAEEGYPNFYMQFVLQMHSFTHVSNNMFNDIVLKSALKTKISDDEKKITVNVQAIVDYFSFYFKGFPGSMQKHLPKIFKEKSLSETIGHLVLLTERIKNVKKRMLLADKIHDLIKDLKSNRADYEDYLDLKYKINGENPFDYFYEKFTLEFVQSTIYILDHKISNMLPDKEKLSPYFSLEKEEKFVFNYTDASKNKNFDDEEKIALRKINEYLNDKNKKEIIEKILNQKNIYNIKIETT